MNFPHLSRRNLLGTGFLGSLLGLTATHASTALAASETQSGAMHHDKHAMGAMMKGEWGHGASYEMSMPWAHRNIAVQY